MNIMAQHTISLPCIADTYLDEENRFTNYGSATQLLIGSRRNNEYYYKSALLRFNITSLPSRKRVTQAKISLFVISKVVDQGGNAYASLLASDFNEYTATAEKYGGRGSYGPFRDIAGILTNQYQDISLFVNFGLHDVVHVSMGGVGADPYYPYLLVASRETANPPILIVTYEDVPPSKPLLLGPVGSYEDNTGIIKLSWNYISSVGGNQKGFNLQWSTDQSTWTTVNQTTANTYYDMPADTLPAGNIYWRVQTLNEYDEASEYSDVGVFYCVGAPVMPIISNITAGSARPTVYWISEPQETYQVQVLYDARIVYDSQSVPRKEYSHKVDTLLEDGDYAVRLRVQNEYGIWSPYSEAQFTIMTTKPQKPRAIMQHCRNGIEVNIVSAVGAGLIQLMRALDDEYICVCKGSPNDVSIYDYSCRAGVEYKYKVRAVSEGDTFSDSDVLSIIPTVSTNVFAPVTDLSLIIELTYNIDKQPDLSWKKNHVSNAYFCAGRKHQIIEKSEHIESSRGYTFCTMTHDEVESFIEMFDKGEIVLWRDNLGRKMYGQLTNLSVTDINGYYQVSFVLSEVDFQEGV